MRLRNSDVRVTKPICSVPLSNSGYVLNITLVVHKCRRSLAAVTYWIWMWFKESNKCFPRLKVSLTVTSTNRVEVTATPCQLPVWWGPLFFGFYLPGIIPYTCPKLVPFDLWCHAELVGIYLQDGYTYLEWISDCKHSEIHSNEWSREPWYFGPKSVYVIPTSSKPKLSCFCNWVHFDMVYFKYAIATVFIKFVSQIYCTVKPVCNDHLYNKIYFLWFIQ